MSAVEVRPATAADAEAVHALETEALGVDAWSRALIEDVVTAPVGGTHALVAVADGVLVGYAVVSVVADLAELQRIAVVAARRRGGIGRRLLDAVRALAAEHGAERLLLEVREDNLPALRLYAAYGFAEIARRRGYYRDGTTAVVLEVALPGAPETRTMEW